ncbi:MAG: hypothetical protein KatS3mg102_1190 [Planctomycetota bacterium]|nr:MAG: hypothetical protein KatS3mg102_1190 [Planctomycetota bacterium]
MAWRRSASGLPDALERREILAGNRPGVDLDALGRAYLQAGWLSDALDCFERTGNREALAELRRLAIERDPFLLERLAALGEVSPAQWAEAARRAEAEGRELHAARCFARAGELEAATRAGERAAALRASLAYPARGRHEPRTSPPGGGDGERSEPAAERGAAPPGGNGRGAA